MKKINIGIKKAMGLWADKPYRRPTDIRCLCVKCLEDYYYVCSTKSDRSRKKRTQ